MCTNGGLGAYCMGSIQTAWDQGHFQEITGEHKFFSDPANPSSRGDQNTVPMQDVDQIKAAVQQINHFSTTANRPLASSSVDLTEYHGAFLGRLTTEYVVIDLNIELATYKAPGYQDSWDVYNPKTF
ncbi:hypothetical protein DFH28DRAFT_1124617 [Melampsora americana]|nr:hypothetical protein DFH28DRAFT_1124617 [Melampsora americana]